MPRQPRKPLTNRDVNVESTTTITPNVSVKSETKEIKNSSNDSVPKAKPEIDGADETREVERLRAEVASLTAKLKSATLGGVHDSKTQDDTGASNPFGGVMPSMAGLVPPSAPTVHKPKRPQTAYQLFSAEHREEVRAADPSIEFHEVNSRLAEMWKAASADKRAEFESRTAEDRERYSREMVAYDAKCEAIKEERCALEHMEQKMIQEKAMELYKAHMAEQLEKGKVGSVNSVDNSDALKKPKKVRSAYIYYTMRRHEEFAKTSEGKPDDVASRIAEEWKALQTSKKKKDRAIVEKFNKMALDDQERFRQEMDAYDAAVAARDAAISQQHNEMRARALDIYRAEKKEREELDALRRLQAEKSEQEKAERAAARAEKKAQKALKAEQPKRARPAYTFFFADKSRDPAVRARAEAEKTSPAAVISTMWKNCSEEEKQRYQTLAAEDRERYQREIAAVGSEK